tara:strand:- start:430 stop:1866 length:1437 start_codon:yes stop_codon:yes gene_type:complete
MSKIDPKKIFDEGLKLFQQQKFDEAIKRFNQVIVANPNNINSLVILSQIYRKKNNLEKYEHYLKKIIHLDKNNYQALNNLARYYKNLGNIEKTKDLLKKAIVANEKYGKAYFNLAILYEETGSLNDAENLYIKALKFEKHTPSIYYKILRLNPSFLDKINITSIKSICENVNYNSEERGYGYFILSINERNKNNFENEINYLNKGHELIFNSDPINAKLDNYWIEVAPKKFSNTIKLNDKINKINDNVDYNPIFVTGLPRSGTSLVEALLSSNKKKISNLGETSIIPRCVENLISDNITDLKKQVFEEYTMILPISNHSEISFIDKTLENIFFLDIIFKLFPKSKIIVCKRNYFHNFVAIFQQCLNGLPWTHKPSSILKYIKNFELLIKSIKENDYKNVLFVNLEDLTNNPEINSKKILNFCELEWNENVLKFYERKDLLIKTASNVQLRKKIFKYNNDKFIPYEKHLKEYFDEINKL